jgi:hypothetical protein
MRRYKSPLIKQVVHAAEASHQASVVVFQSQFDNPNGLYEPGGMCSCCGAGPRVTSRHDWWLVFRGGICDSDGVYYSQLCAGPNGGCLTDLREENARRKRTSRDRAANIVNDLMGNDVDGAQAFMEDLSDIDI